MDTSRASSVDAYVRYAESAPSTRLRVIIIAVMALVILFRILVSELPSVLFFIKLPKLPIFFIKILFIF